MSNEQIQTQEQTEQTTQEEITQEVAEEFNSRQFAEELSEEHIRLMKDLAPQEQYEIHVNGKPLIFKRRKIFSGERKALEVMRQKLTNSLTENKEDYPDLEDKLYKKMAQLYLINQLTGKGMTDTEFNLTEFEEIKQILNACAFRTERPIPSPFGK